MCGRFTLTEPQKLRAAFPRFRFPEFSEVRLPRFNIAPTQPVLGVRDDGDATADVLVWGIHGRINARAEGLSARSAPLRRRCAIFADGFFEWRAKRPIYFTLEDRAPFAFAGIWQPEREGPASCAIVTCAPNELVRAVHDRMPVLLADDALERWLSPEALPGAAAATLLRPYPAAGLRAREVSRRLNSARYDAPDVLEPDALQPTLFGEGTS